MSDVRRFGFTYFVIVNTMRKINYIYLKSSDLDYKNIIFSI